MRSEIEALLDEATRREFKNTTTTIMQYGNRKAKFLAPRRQKLREIVTSNKQIAVLYNRFAKAHTQQESRLTYRLPVFEELEVEDVQEHEDADDEAVGDIHAQHERQEDETLMLMEAETGREMEQTMPTEEKDDEDRQDETVSVALQLQTPMATSLQGARTAIGIGNSDMNERAATTAAHHGQVQPSGEVTATGKESPSHPETHPEPPQEPPQQLATVSLGSAIPAQPESIHLMASEPQPKTHVLVTPVTNPEAFPIDRIQDIQALRYPRAKIVGGWAHQNTIGDVVQVTVDMQDGPVNHIIIDDARLIFALGLREGNNDVISIQHDHLRIDETFDIRLFPNQHPQDLNAFVVGELVSARHAYLYWLDLRGSADPKGAPYVQQARDIATQLGRRAPHVWKEIESYWELEHGSGGKMYRDKRMKYLGEDPVYPKAEEAKKREQARSMWG
jgi:hypothetical protein